MTSRRPSVPYRHATRDAQGNRFCCWCGTGIKAPRLRWCGDSCVREYKIAKGDQGAAKRAIRDRDGKGETLVCALCSCTLERYEQKGAWRDQHDVATWEADHTVPICEGGALHLDNLRALCVPCHRNATRELRRRQAERRRLARQEQDAPLFTRRAQ